jgi:hypothetical protein
MAVGQMFGNLLGQVARQGSRFGKTAMPLVKSAAVPAAALGVGAGLVGLGKAGVDVIQGDRRATGSSPLTGEDPGISIEQINQLYRMAGNLSAEQAAKILPTIQKLEESRLRNSMDATRQVGQIQGDLARQKYGFQLAGGAQQVGLGTLQSLMSNPNPYAQTGLSGVSSLSL